MASTSIHKELRNSKFEIRNSLFEWLWRFAILLSPLQTRWFADASLNGWPWEQGRLSFYISWFPVLATIIIGLFIAKRGLPEKFRRNLFLLIAVLAAVNVVAFPYSVAASAMWWTQIFILILFFITLYKAKVHFNKIAFWFMLAILPSAIFAIVQIILQYVPGWSWIGVASQNPMNLGVSVVQTAEMRWLRAYGLLPHPNILGGYMAFGIILSSWLIKFSSSQRKSVRFLLLTSLPIFTTALFYSFSRSAWLASIVGLVILLTTLLLTKEEYSERSRRGGWWVALLSIPLTFGILAAINWPLLSSRISSSPTVRLEQQSNTSRIQSLKNGIQVFQANPLFGTGPNAELPASLQMQREPPHNVFILILANFGIVGSLAILGFIIYLLQQIFKNKKTDNRAVRNLSLSLLATCLVIAMFDHYLYSLWSGQLLSIFALSSLLTQLPLVDDKARTSPLVKGGHPTQSVGLGDS